LPHHGKLLWELAVCAAILIAGFFGVLWLSKQTPEFLFWKPVLDTPGPVLLAVGDVPNGPPQPLTAEGSESATPAILQSDATRSVPFADAVTIAKVVGVLQANGNNVDEYTNVNAPFPMPDALQEFSVQTSNYNAEYGQNADGVVNIITKS
jgi:hypothetical protein